MPAIKGIATVSNPLVGVGVSLVETLFTKPKEKVKTMMNGKKSYLGLAVTFAAFIAQQLGYDVPVEAQEGVSTSLAQIVQAFGVFMASIGLVHKADKAIKKQ